MSDISSSEQVQNSSNLEPKIERSQSFGGRDDTRVIDVVDLSSLDDSLM